MDKLFNVIRANRSFKSAIKDAEIVAEIKRNWLELFGRLGEDLQFSFFRQGTLFIESDNPAWVTEIGRLHDEFIHKIHQKLGKKNIIRRIVVRKKGT